MSAASRYWLFHESVCVSFVSVNKYALLSCNLCPQLHMILHDHLDLATNFQLLFMTSSSLSDTISLTNLFFVCKWWYSDCGGRQLYERLNWLQPADWVWSNRWGITFFYLPLLWLNIFLLWNRTFSNMKKECHLYQCPTFWVSHTRSLQPLAICHRFHEDISVLP